MNIIKKRTPKFLSATCLSFALVLGVPTPAGGELLSFDVAPMPQEFAQKETTPFIDMLASRKAIIQKKETIKSIVEDLQNNYAEYLLANTPNFLSQCLEDSKTTIDEETLQKIFNDCNTIYEQVKKSKEIDELNKQKAALEAAIQARGQNIKNASYNTPSPGYGLCAAWVSTVLNNAGLGYLGGNANDMYWACCTSSDRNIIREGMIIAVPTHNLTYLGGIYGHVGIILQHDDGSWYVRDNIGYINETPLDEWISMYGAIAEVKWGWSNPV